MISIDEAFNRLDQQVERMPPIDTALAEMVGRVLVSNIQADVDSPPHDKSVMDGYALCCQDWSSGVRRFEVVETVVAGAWPTEAIEPGMAVKIMTGAPLPQGADAVIMVEMTESETVNGVEWVTVRVDSLSPERHILRQGVNFSKGQVVLPRGHTVRPNDIGLLAEVGAHSIVTPRQPTVAVIPTGDELVDCQRLPERGQIRNSNGPMLVAMSRSLGLDVTDLGVGRDDPDALKKLIEAGLERDLLLLSGGVSAGTMDLVPGILNDLGVKEVFHRVCVKPGKPIWFGVLEKNGGRTIVFGLPGNPVSSLVGFQLFVRAAIRKLMGGEIRDIRMLTGELANPHETRGNRPTYWPGQMVVDESPIRKFKALIWRGSSDLFSLGESDGLIYFPADSSHHRIGELVQFLPFHV